MVVGGRLRLVAALVHGRPGHGARGCGLEAAEAVGMTHQPTEVEA